MWVAKLKKKKIQYLLLGIIFTIAIALISVSTIVTVVSNTFAAKYYEGDSTPDLVLITTSDSVLEKSYRWYESKGSEARNYKKYEIFSVSTNLSFNDKINDTIASYVVPINHVDDLSNKVAIMEGNSTEIAPKPGEIWIPSTVATLKNIKIGDQLEIIDVKGDSLEFNVSAIVNDSNQSSTAMGVLFVYINEAERERLTSLPISYMATMNCNGDTSEDSKDLVSYINEPLGGIIVDKSLFIMSATMTATLTGGLGLMSSIILTVVLILILRSNIKNNILKECKSIGIYKSIGYSSKNIRNIYLNGYGLVSISSSIIGMIISIPIITVICNIAFSYLGIYRFDLISFMILLLAFIIFNLIIYLNVYFVLKCINQIKPVEAINIGLKSSKEKIKKSVIKDSSGSLSMAINDIFKYKKSNFITLVLFIIVFYMSTLFVNIAHTMMTLDGSLYKIFGTANADLVIAAPSDIEDSISDIKQYLDEDNRVEGYYLWDVLGKSKVTMDNSRYNVDSGSLMATVYDKYNEDDFSIIQGVNPRNEKEVSLSIDIMNSNHLKIGDYLTLNIEGESRELLIVGSFASMMSNGQSLRLTQSVLSNDSNGNVAFVKLNNINDFNDLKKNLEKEFKGIVVDNIYAPLRDTASQVVETSIPISIILSTGVIIFGIFNIVNILITNNFDNRKSYGIMKSLGFTSSYIKRRSNYRIMTLAILGAIIGVTLMASTSKQLMLLMLGFDVFHFSLNATAILVLIIFMLMMITMHFCNKSIKKISTVELIIE